MTTDTYEKALRQIAGLLKLAERATTSEEAAVAAARASELMQRYQIDREVALEEALEKDEAIERFDYDDALDADMRDGRRSPAQNVPQWRWALASAVMRAHGCAGYMGWAKFGRTIAIVGRPSDAATVRYVYKYVLGECARFVEERGKGKGKAWRNNFRLGFVQAIAEKLQEAKIKAQKDALAGCTFEPTHELRVRWCGRDEEAYEFEETVLVRRSTKSRSVRNRAGRIVREIWDLFTEEEWRNRETRAMWWEDQEGDVRARPTHPRYGTYSVDAAELRALDANESKNALALARVENAIARIEQRDDDADEWMNERLDLSTARRHGSVSFDEDAREAGREAGSSVHLGKAKGALGAGGSK